MFLCEKCLPLYKIDVHIEFCRKSFGHCEECACVGECFDIPHNCYQKISIRRKMNPSRRDRGKRE